MVRQVSERIAQEQVVVEGLARLAVPAKFVEVGLDLIQHSCVGNRPTIKIENKRRLVVRVHAAGREVVRPDEHEGVIVTAARDRSSGGT
jgi:hypothetical protein